MIITYNVKELRELKIHKTIYIGSSITINYIQFLTNKSSSTKYSITVKYTRVIFGLVATLD